MSETKQADKASKATKAAGAESLDLQEVGEQIAKRGRGRPKGTGGNVREDRMVVTEPGDNRRYMANAMEIYLLPKIDLEDPVQVEERVKQYFTIVAKNDMKPSVEGLALALGVGRQRVWEMRTKESKGREVADIIKKATDFINNLMADYMQNGKINPVSGIFLMKNNFGYTDKQEVIVTPQSPLGDSPDRKALEDRYVDAVVDVDPADSD